MSSRVARELRLALGLLGIVAAACSGDEQPVTAADGAVLPGESDAGSDASGPLCAPDNPYCSGGAEAGVSCGNEPIDLTPVGVNIMVAVDGSASMGKHWPLIQAALRDLRNSHPDSAIGLHLFWGVLQEDLQSGLSKNNWCGATNNRVLDVGDNSESALLDFLGATSPGPSFLGGLFETSPVIEPLNYYLSNASKLADPSRTNYLLFITDGNDNCFGSVYTNKADKLIAYQKLAVELQKLNIRTLPIGFDAASTDNSGLFGTTPPKTDLEVLGTLLQYGGTGLSQVPKADSPSKLKEVVAKVGEIVRNCRFSIPAALDPTTGVNGFQLDFSIAGVRVPRDRQMLEGWNFVNGDATQVELFGQACEAVRAGEQLVAQKTCEENVCGSASVKVETRKRAILFMLDSSASRIECSDGSFNCLVTSDWNPQRPLTFWEVVQNSLGQSMVAPINDDADFGLQFFPGKEAANFSCDVATLPEVAVADGTEITILSRMLEKLPFGFTPLVQALENVSQNPGPLAEPDVLGSVVILSDGGDNCAGVPQDQIVSRLGDAAARLLQAGVKTHVVRYGSPQGKSAEQDAQLRAIVAQGGTASSDPADPSVSPYIDAKSAAELTQALAAISDQLATCAFALGGLDENADRANANLYLNGEVVPFDVTGTHQGGWSWVEGAEPPAIELFGDACQLFKTSRKTSVVVEFGCPAVPLL